MIYKEKRFTGERALFSLSDCEIADCIFDDGESPLKHSKRIKLSDSSFQWKYPLWYSEDITLENCTLHDTARAGIWYTHGITINDTLIAAPKTFRRSTGIRLNNCDLTNAAETFWNCSDIELENVVASGDYFMMNSSDIKASHFRLSGNYAFDGVKNVEITDSKLITKDAFWNTENVTVKNSYICGEYIGWNSKGLTFIDCTIESLQGLCYIDGLVMKNCRLLNTELAFEYSSADAEITTDIVSVKNPYSGTIRAKSIGELILDPERIDPDATTIITEE